MKVIDAITEVDNLKANMFTLQDKIKWLSRLDLRIQQQIIDTHQLNEGEEDSAFTGYSEDDTEKELLVGEPYAEMYIHWLEAQIDYNNMEYDGFNAANAMFESIYSSFRNAYNASHLAKGRKRIYF